MEDIYEYNKRRRFAFINNVPFERNEEYEKILCARYMKVSRVKRRITYLLCRYKYNYFITFTFDDEEIEKCDRTKKDMIKHSLLDFDEKIKIILNIDFGSKNDREHYHAVVSTNCCCDIDMFLRLRYPCFIKVEKIRLDEVDISKLSKYINKLSNHATKESTKRSRIYYNFKGYDDIIFKDEEKWKLFYKDTLFLQKKVSRT